jgi:hypothetical protein
MKMVSYDPCTRLHVILNRIVPTVEAGDPAFKNFVKLSIKKLDELEDIAISLNNLIKEQKDVNKIKNRFKKARNNVLKSFARYKAIEYAKKKREDNPMYV